MRLRVRGPGIEQEKVKRVEFGGGHRVNSSFVCRFTKAFGIYYIKISKGA